MFGSQKIQELLDVSAITTLLDTFVIGSTSYPMIARGHLVPDAWGPQASTINYYTTSSIAGGIEYGAFSYTVNCRAATELRSQEIAQAIYTALNRDVQGSYGVVCSIMPSIPPMDETDNFNTIIEVTLRTDGTIA